MATDVNILIVPTKHVTGSARKVNRQQVLSISNKTRINLKHRSYELKGELDQGLTGGASGLL